MLLRSFIEGNGSVPGLMVNTEHARCSLLIVPRIPTLGVQNAWHLVETDKSRRFGGDDRAFLFYWVISERFSDQNLSWWLVLPRRDKTLSANNIERHRLVARSAGLAFVLT